MPKVAVTARSNSEIYPLQPSRPVSFLSIQLPLCLGRWGGGEAGLWTGSASGDLGPTRHPLICSIIIISEKLKAFGPGWDGAGKGLGSRHTQWPLARGSWQLPRAHLS